MRIASLAMYVDPPPVRQATRQLWAHLRDSLRAGGMADVPDTADEAMPVEQAWLDPRLLLAQACAHPCATWLRGHVRLVTTPCYDHPGCSGPYSGSFVVVRQEERVHDLADLAGRHAAINYPTSNTGTNLLRATIAPLADGGRFFASVVATGSHVASIAAIAAGAADVAAIDRVTWGNLARHAPERIAGLRILAETPATPALPLITRGAASDSEVAALRQALDAALAAPALAEARTTLGLTGFVALGDADYDMVAGLEREAIALAYPRVA